jgi:hypothetical protein
MLCRCIIMSVQTIAATGQINAFVCPCTVSGAISGNTNITFRRFNNIVYLSIPSLVGNAVPGLSFTITPTAIIPNEYLPLNSSVRLFVGLNNNNNAPCYLAISSTLANFICTNILAANFTGTTAILDYTCEWQPLIP